MRLDAGSARNEQGKTPFFLARRAEPAGTLQVYYLKTTRLCVGTGTGIRHLVLDAVGDPEAAGAGD